MSIDAQAGERQHAVRGRVKDKPEIEADPTLPMKPSTFPLVPALVGLVLVVGAFVGVVVMRASNRPGPTEDEQRRLATVTRMQEHFETAWSEKPQLHGWFSCGNLREIVHRTCKPTVEPGKLAFDTALRALSDPDNPKACNEAATAFLASRVAARCD